MEVVIRDVRGSIANPSLDTAFYGGNAACAELRADGGAPLFFDAGTGLREAGDAMCCREDYASGWGHSAWEEWVDAAAKDGRQRQNMTIFLAANRARSATALAAQSTSPNAS
jgi:hypothetical protein